MLLRPLVCTGLVALTAAGHAPATLRYEISVRGTAAGMRVERTGGGPAEGTFAPRPVGMRAVVAVALADSAGGRSVRASMDSLDDGRPAQAAAAGEPQGPGVRIVRPDDGLPATGAKWSARIDAAGRLAALRVDSRSRGSRTLDDVVPLLLPYVPGRLSKGAAWSDTTDVTAPTPDGSQHLRMVTAYRVAGEEQVQGAKVWRVEVALDGTRETKAAVQDETLTTTAATKGRGIYHFGRDGRLVDGRLEREHQVRFEAGALAAPVTGTGADTVRVALSR